MTATLTSILGILSTGIVLEIFRRIFDFLEKRRQEKKLDNSKTVETSAGVLAARLGLEGEQFKLMFSEYARLTQRAEQAEAKYNEAELQARMLKWANERLEKEIHELKCELGRTPTDQLEE